jgi:hypothetical protein
VWRDLALGPAGSQASQQWNRFWNFSLLHHDQARRGPSSEQTITSGFMSRKTRQFTTDGIVGMARARATGAGARKRRKPLRAGRDAKTDPIL